MRFNFFVFSFSQVYLKANVLLCHKIEEKMKNGEKQNLDFDTKAYCFLKQPLILDSLYRLRYTLSILNQVAQERRV